MIRLLALVSFVVVAQAVGESDFDTLLVQVERAVVKADVEKLAQHRDELARHPERWRIGDGLRQYTLAYIDWRSSTNPSVSDNKQRKHLFQAAQGILESLIKSEPDNVEVQALLGSIYGGQITGMWTGMTLGPRAGRALRAAEKLAPDNPRVLLQQGISAFFTPKAFGGGLQRAEEKLRGAEAAFDRQPAETTWPNWGRVDVQVWLGQVLEKKGDRVRARAAYEKGLVMEPDHWWLRKLLVPRRGTTPRELEQTL